MDFVQLERHCRLLDVIDQYRRLLSQYDNNLKAVQFDGMPHAGTYQADKLGEIVIRKEQALDKLQRLQVLAAAEAPQVQETIAAACSSRGRAAVKVELAMTMRYQRGESWDMICDVLHEPNPRQIRNLVISRLKQLERARQKDGIDTGTAGGAV